MNEQTQNTNDNTNIHQEEPEMRKWHEDMKSRLQSILTDAFDQFSKRDRTWLHFSNLENFVVNQIEKHTSFKIHKNYKGISGCCGDEIFEDCHASIITALNHAIEALYQGFNTGRYINELLLANTVSYMLSVIADIDFFYGYSDEDAYISGLNEIHRPVERYEIHGIDVLEVKLANEDAFAQTS